MKEERDRVDTTGPASVPLDETDSSCTEEYRPERVISI